MQFIQYVCALLNAIICLAVIHEPARASSAAPLDLVGAIIIADEMDNDIPIFLTFTHELVLIIGNVVEKGIANGFNECCFASPICSTDGGCAAPVRV